MASAPAAKTGAGAICGPHLIDHGGGRRWCDGDAGTRRARLRAGEQRPGTTPLAYLHDHLGGAEVAIQIVEQMRRTSTERG